MMFIYLTDTKDKNKGKFINTDRIEQIGHFYYQNITSSYVLGIVVSGKFSPITEEQYNEIMEQLPKPSEKERKQNDV